VSLIKWLDPTAKLYLFNVGEGQEKEVVEDRLARTTVRFVFPSAVALFASDEDQE
jgi:hypothetical protein